LIAQSARYIPAKEEAPDRLAAICTLPMMSGLIVLLPASVVLTGRDPNKGAVAVALPDRIVLSGTVLSIEPAMLPTPAKDALQPTDASSVGEETVPLPLRLALTGRLPDRAATSVPTPERTAPSGTLPDRDPERLPTPDNAASTAWSVISA
jgi:hypothetical protein